MAALLPLFAVSVLPTQLRTLVCRFTGAVMDVETCCPDRDAQTPVGAQLSEQGCCVVKTVDLGRLVAEPRSEGAPPPEVAAVVAARTPEFTLADATCPAPRPYRPPTVGPPLVLLKRSFLI
jgi:hypothetical protein